ncbi:MAG: EAL domain-containing protein, partial [Mycobacteriaceae bacterium]
ARATKVMAELKQLGVRLALDDFGTGYSSLSYLRQYPFDILKIDQIFLATMGRDPAAAAIVAAIANLAHALGLSVIAEGVETQEQRREIIALGCEFAQGFLYSTPIPARELASLLQSSSEGELYLLPPDAA